MIVLQGNKVLSIHGVFDMDEVKRDSRILSNVDFMRKYDFAYKKERFVMDYPKKRELDVVYFRVERNGKWETVCFTDLTRTEREKVISGKSREWLESLCIYLSGTLRQFGDDLDIYGGVKGENDK